MVQNIRVPHMSVRKSELWQNGWLASDAVWGGERGRSRNGYIKWGGDHWRGMGSFWGEFGRPNVTNGAFATHSSQITLRTCYYC